MNLYRIRWGCRAVLGVAVSLSVVGNVLHAPHDGISQGMSALPPLVLWATIELIAKVPTARRAWTWGRRAVCLGIGGMAAWISYWHMAAVAARYGEVSRGSAYLYPLLVDCLVVVAWICLAELADRIRDGDRHEGGTDGREAGEVRDQGAAPRPALRAASAAGEDRAGIDDQGGAGDPAGEEEVAAEPVKLSPPRKPHPSSAKRIEQAHRKHPTASNAELATRLKLSPATVKRYRPPAAQEGAQPEPVNGNVPDLERVTL